MNETTRRVVHEQPVLFRPNMTEISSRQVVCGYARVSTENEEQEDSFERQVEHFTALIRAHSDWVFGGVYADHGITGTRAEARLKFMEMIEACRAGKINRILVKSVSRFARNTVDSLSYIRELKELGVSVYFENENIDTLTPGGEVLITILAAIAEQESRNMSTNIKWAFQKRFKNGDVIIGCNTLGYTKEDDHYVIVLKDAMTVQRIFREFVCGKTAKNIADGLNADGIKTIKGNQWYSSSVLNILGNEKYTGNALMGKTFKPDVLSKNRVKNEGQAPSYYIENSHPAIISEDMYKIAQSLRKTRKELRSSSKTGHGRYSAKYPLSGLLVCANCGSKFRRHKRSQKNGTKVPMWICIRHEKEAGVCDVTPIREDRVMKAYGHALERLTDDVSATLERIKHNAEDLMVRAHNDELARIEQEIAQYQDKIIGLFKAKREQTITAVDYQLQYEEFSKKVTELQDIKNEILRQDNEMKIEKHRLEDLINILENSAELDIKGSGLMTMLLEKVVVKTPTRLRFEFMCGEAIEENIE